jgi:gliding motility-associated-like protein
VKLSFKIILLVFLFLGIKLNGQLSKVHYIPPLTTSNSGNPLVGSQFFYISTPSQSVVNYKIIVGDGTIWNQGVVSNANPVITPANSQGNSYENLFISDFDYEKIIKKGFIVEAESEIYVSLRFEATSTFHAGAIVSKGESALGKRFYVGALRNRANYMTQFASVMATEDVTKVTFKLKNNVSTINGQSGEFEVILNSGDSYLITSRSGFGSIEDGLIGTLIESDKSIVVNTGSGTGSNALNNGGHDYGMDQIVGADLVGSEYIFIKGDGEPDWEKALVIANQDNTQLQVNGSDYGSPLQEGQFLFISEYTSDNNMYISTKDPSHKLFAYQSLGRIWTESQFQNSRAANQGMFFVPPLNCSNRGNVDNIAKIDDVANKSYTGAVTFVTKKNAEIFINGQSISDVQNSNGPFNVTGKDDYVTYRVDNLTGNISVVGNDELYVAYFNYNGAATTGGFYSGFSRPPKIDFDIELETLGSCIKKDGESNITLKASDISNFTSIVWEYLENGNFISTGITTNEFTPTQSGTYRLKGILDCSESTFVSNETTVFICADDFDNDGIIDNIDLDSDNDGIINKYESLGDGLIDFSNLSSPDIILENNPSNIVGGIIAVDIPQNSHTQSGGVGNITSTVNPGRDQEVDINISFNEKLNIKISETSAFEIQKTGEEFELKVTPSESSVTLLDPDKNLLIEINGVWQEIDIPFTANTIKFRYKSRVNNTFEFHASKIDGISFKHVYNNISSNDKSIFAPKIEVISYYLNTDGTDLEDMFDIDSDNDGCYDVIEAGYDDSDNDGIYGQSIPNIKDGTVNSRGLIIDQNYNPNDEPKKDNNGKYYFQKIALAPEITTQPQSAIACQVGTSVEFNVSVNSNDNIFYQWQKFDITISSWQNLENNDSYENVSTAALTVNNVDLSMNGDKFRVIVNTDEYACYIESNDDIELQVEEALPIVNTIDNLIICDDTSAGSDADGKVSGIDLTNNIDLILGLTQNQNDFNVSFHLSDISANDLTNQGVLDPSNYSNINSTESIYVRVQNKVTLCYNTIKSFDLIIAELPVIINPLITLEQCDSDEDNNGKTKFNLTDYENLISSNHENETFEYYKDLNLTEKIIDPTDFENTILFNQSIYVKIITDQDCFRESRIDLKVGASLIDSNFMENFSKCETSPSNSQDGIEFWDASIFKELNTKLVASDSKFSDQNISISYYSSENDALTKKNQIDFESSSFSYSNTTRDVQEIWASVEVNDLDTVTCLGLKQVATLFVEPRPIANAVTIDRQCDGDNELDLDSQDGIYPFDVSLIEEQVINGQTDVTVTYFNEDGTQIQNFSPVFESASQTITIRVEKDPSYPNITNPDGLCYDETTLEFIVDDAPEIFPVTIQAQCDDGEDDSDGFSEFDTSNITNSLLGPNQNLTDYSISYSYKDEEGNLLISNELRNPFNTNTQTVIATITSNINQACSVSTEIDFIVNPLPSFTVDDDTIVCLNLPPIPIGVTSSEAEYTYTWEHEDLNGNLSPFPVSGPTIDIGVGGTYYVTATTTDGTNCSRTLSIDVEESIIATITPNDITVEDLTNDNNNTITIDPTNLGIGDYEYAIDDPAGPYQNDPFFEQVRPGIHTIYIRDKNDCGIAQIDVSVIGYKKFFTPNGDGIHDTWRILGIREDFQPNSKVYIFDRYGKLLKDLDPVAEGWDGTFIGRPMPQTDYWFRVFLEDGREFKGHFSLVRGK